MKILIKCFSIAEPMKVLAKHYIIENVDIGENTVIRDFVNIFGCKIGKNCKIAAFVEIQKDVTIGDKCAIEAFAFIPTGVTIEDEVFIGPHVCFTNDLKPRAVNPDWKVIPTTVKKGASIGAGSVIICGITIGEGSMVGAGSVVTKDVPPYTLVAGNPAKTVKKLER
jgi:acetyltransferase-like isoleucine patch superfamily enzyme